MFSDFHFFFFARDRSQLRFGLFSVSFFFGSIDFGRRSALLCFLCSIRPPARVRGSRPRHRFFFGRRLRFSPGRRRSGFLSCASRSVPAGSASALGYAVAADLVSALISSPGTISAQASRSAAVRSRGRSPPRRGGS
jgi:hypothetical protein